MFTDAEAALAAAHATATDIAANSPLVVRGIKDVLDEQRTADVAASLRYVAAWNSAFLPSKDLRRHLGAVGQAYSQFHRRVAGRPSARANRCRCCGQLRAACQPRRAMAAPPSPVIPSQSAAAEVLVARPRTSPPEVRAHAHDPAE